MIFSLRPLTKTLVSNCLICFIAALLLAFVGSCALAQSDTGWQPRLNYTGSGSWSPKQGDTDSQTQTFDAQGAPKLYYPPYVTNAPKPDAVCSFTATATVDVIMEWVPAADAPDPPVNERQKIYVKIVSSASGSADWENGYSPSATTDANNGMQSGIVGNIKSTSSSGTKLVEARVSQGADGKWRANAGTYTLSAKAEVQPYGYSYYTSARYIWERAEVGLHLTAQKDTRAVAISRRGARGETVDAEGNKHGHTTYSFYEKSFYYSEYGSPIEQTNNVPNWQQFDASLAGGWSTKAHYPYYGAYEIVPDVYWSWNPQDPNATLNWNQWLMPFGSQNKIHSKWKGKTGPTNAVLTYSVTDVQDGANASAKYYLTIHDHYEQKTYQEFLNRQENIRDYPGAMPVVSNYPNSALNVYVETSKTFTLGVSCDGEIAEWMADVLGINVEASYSFSVTVGQGVTVNGVEAGWGTTLQVFDIFNYYRGTVDIWDEAGYVGEGSYNIKKPVGVGITSGPLVQYYSGPPP